MLHYNKGSDSMFKLLVVEDDQQLNRSVCIFLRENGFEVVGCLDAYEAYETMYNQTFDLLISDIMLPKIDGYEFVKNVRKQDENIPILFMSAREDIQSKSKGFHVGIDDYLVKPVNLEELLLRVEALLRRAKIMAKRKLHIGDVELDLDEHTCYIQDEEVVLTVKEFNILFKLLSYPKKTFTRTQLMDAFWDSDTMSTRVVDVYITKLREKISKSKSIEIVTVHGLGYKAVLK